MTAHLKKAPSRKPIFGTITLADGFSISVELLKLSHSKWITLMFLVDNASIIVSLHYLDYQIFFP